MLLAREGRGCAHVVRATARRVRASLPSAWERTPRCARVSRRTGLRLRLVWASAPTRVSCRASCSGFTHEARCGCGRVNASLYFRGSASQKEYLARPIVFSFHGFATRSFAPAAPHCAACDTTPCAQCRALRKTYVTRGLARAELCSQWLVPQWPDDSTSEGVSALEHVRGSLRTAPSGMLGIARSGARPCV